MKNRILFASIFLAALAGASPLHQVTIASHPFQVNGGGRFTGTLDGHFTDFWCVDEQNSVSVPDSFHAYRTTADDAAGTPTDSNYDTRFENETFAYSVNGSSTNAEYRYRMAMYLVSLYDESLGGGHEKNQAIQSSIWKSTFLTTQSLNTIYDSTDYFSQAENFVSANYNSPLFHQYAIVSGFRGNTLGNNGYEQIQTFLTAVPEPSTYALFGTGVLCILTMRRRKA